MIRLVLLLLLILSAPQAAFAEAKADCFQQKDLDRQISGCNRYIDANVSSRNTDIWWYVTEAIIARGRAYRLKEQHDLAIRDLTRAYKREESRGPLILLNRAMSYEAIGERDKAIADYKAVVQSHEKYSRFNYRALAAHAKKALARLGVKVPEKEVPLAELIRRFNKESMAELDIDDSLSVKTEDFASTKRARKIERLIGRRGVPLQRDSKTKSQNDKSRAQANKLAKARIAKAESDFKQGVQLRKKGSFDKAIELHTAALQRFPTTPEHRLSRAETYLDRGRAHFAKKQYDKAISDYTEVLKLDPREFRALNNRGISYRRKKQYDKAIADLSAAIKIKPNNFVFYFNRGGVHRDKAMYPQAIADFDRALKLNPKSADTYRQRGNVYTMLGNEARAKADYAKARKLNPGIEINPPRPAAKKTGNSASKEMELAFWNDVKDSKDPNMLQAYLDEFPNGTFARLAKIKLKKLKKVR